MKGPNIGLDVETLTSLWTSPGGHHRLDSPRSGGLVFVDSGMELRAMWMGVAGHSRIIADPSKVEGDEAGLLDEGRAW